MLIAQRPTLTEESLNPQRSRFTIEPLEPGFGYTLGNSLRRTLLSSIPGAAVTSIKIEGNQHEFSTIEGVVEDVTEVVLNLKGLVLSSEEDEPVVMYLRKAGAGAVTAADIKAANNEGAHVQGCISYTLSPVHNNEYYVKYAKTLEEMGANSICIKDMAGLLTPYTCYDLVKKLKETVSIPVDIHSHYTAGLASMSILKGIEAGADIIDTAMSPLSLGTSHMPTESLVAALQGTDYDTGLDLKQLNVVRAYFAKLREKYIANGQISPKSLGVDANTLLYQVPGGMFSNMLKQLKDAGKEDKLDEVLAEIPRVREDAGYPPLVTPTSQIVGTQAVFNVIMGERYKMVTKEFKGLVHGDYGKTPAPIKKEFSDFILKGEEPITCRFADTLAPEMDKLKAEAAKYAIQEEDVLTYAMFPQVAPKFFEKRNARMHGVDALHADYENKSHPV